MKSNAAGASVGAKASQPIRSFQVHLGTPNWPPTLPSGSLLDCADPTSQQLALSNKSAKSALLIAVSILLIAA